MTVKYDVTYQPGFIFIDDSGAQASYGSLSEEDISAKIAEHLS